MGLHLVNDLALVTVFDGSVEVRTFGSRVHQSLMHLRWYAAEVVCSSLFKSDLHPTSGGVVAHGSDRR